MARFVIPATLLRRGYKVTQDAALRRAFPGTGTNVTRRDFSQYQFGKLLSWNLGYTSINQNTAVFGSGKTGV